MSQYGILGDIALKFRIVLHGIVLNYVIFIGRHCGQPIQQPINNNDVI